MLFLCFLCTLIACQSKEVVLITGCSSGIGKAAAIAFAEHGDFIVYATMRSTSHWMSDELPASLTDTLHVRQLDVTSTESIRVVVDEILKVEGRIDVVINNAGYGIAGCLEAVSVEEAKKVFEVNVWGVVNVLQAVLPSMRSRGRGHVINISSTSGIRGIPCFEFYTGSKFALEGITDSMRYSLSLYNISVTNVNAGPVRTSFTERFGDASMGGKGTRRAANDELLQAYTDKMVRNLNERMSSSEVQSAEEIGRLLVELALSKRAALRLEDVPFNLATSPSSQKVLELTRVNPRGWGGIYSSILDSVPSSATLLSHRSEEL